MEKMREAIKALKVAYIYAQRVDWYLSGDDGEENFLSRLEKELKIEMFALANMTMGIANYLKSNEE